MTILDRLWNLSVGPIYFKTIKLLRKKITLSSILPIMEVLSFIYIYETHKDSKWVFDVLAFKNSNATRVTWVQPTTSMYEIYHGTYPSFTKDFDEGKIVIN